MPILNRAAEMQEEVAGWRRRLHSRPELEFDCYDTAAFVAEKLRAFGCDEVATGIAKTGVVGIIKGRLGDGPTIGLRSDMDALPITEITGQPYASETKGSMHACGHDGHMAMLLGAAKYLAETRNFAGSVAVIFQPAEEGGGGGNVMVREGMMERFGISRVFGMHNEPGAPIGSFSTRPGAIMAATGEFEIRIKGRGGHAAMPNQTVDPIVIGSQIVTALQTIVSRNVDPVEPLVVSVTKFQAGDAWNIIPSEAVLWGTVRTLSNENGALAERRIRAIVDGLCKAGEADYDLSYEPNYPVTVNDPDEAAFAAQVAAAVAGEANVDPDRPPTLGAEDFSYMLEARPGAFVFIGNGDSAGLHHPAYDFNDEAIPHGVSYWVKLTETALAA